MKALILLTLSLMSFSAFSKPTQVYDVPRGECLMFPKLLDLEKMVRGVHYSIERDSMYGCVEDSHGNIRHNTCSDRVTMFFHYRYSDVRTTEHYTADGKLFTTSVDKTAKEIIEVTSDYTRGEWTYGSDSYTPADEAAKQMVRESYAEAKEALEMKITRAIYESNNGACADSYYK